MTTLAEAGYLLKSVYLSNDQIEQFAEDTILFKLFKKDNRWVKNVGAGQGTNTPTTYGMVWPIETGRNTRVGFFNLSSPSLLPPDGRSGAQAFTNLAAGSASLLLDAILFEAAKNDDQAFENVVERNMTTLFEDLQNSESRVMWGNGNGQLGVVGSVNGQVVTLDNSLSGRFLPVTKFTQVNALLTILSPTGTDRTVNGGLVTACNDITGTFTISAGTSLASVQAGDFIYTYQSFTAGSSTGIEPLGLNAYFGNNNTVAGVNPSTQSKWTPATIITNNTDPTEAVLEQMRSYISTYGAKANVAVTHPLVISKFSIGLLTYKRITSTDIPGGVKTYEDANKLEGPEMVGLGPIIPDSNTPLGAGNNTAWLWMGNKESIFLGEAGPMHWMDEDGQILKPIVGSASVSSPTQAQYVAYLLHYWQMGVYRRRSGAMATSMNMLVAA